MLVLSRKQNEAIQIGDSIEIVVSRIQRNRVRLAITAPASVPVHRREVAVRIDTKRGSPPIEGSIPDTAASHPSQDTTSCFLTFLQDDSPRCPSEWR
jgi:carbon storage regulator